MTTTVSFPGLGLEFELNRVAFSIGSFNVYWYGLLIGIGFMLAGAYAVLNARKVGVDGDRLIDVVMVGLVCGVIGARLYYVIFDWDAFRTDLSKIFDIRQGGLAIYGGIIAGMAGGVMMAKMRRVRVRPALDLAAAGFLIGQGIGRWGNFVNVEAFGSNTNSIFGMTGPKVVGYLTQVKNSGAAWAQNIDPTCRYIPPSCMSRCGA
ncbi:MAG: prolipoprotein diacylglyceryl transferase [Acutalibacteraceae bacterium]